MTNLHIKYKNVLDDANISTPLVLAHFFTQISAENPLNKLKAESLYYTSIERLRSVFKTPFKGKSDAFVSQYLRNSEKCANYVYAKRGGNGDEASGDGFKYRGRPYMQTTGFDNYHKLSLHLGVDLLEDPDLLLEEQYAFASAVWYWDVNNLNKYAMFDNLDAVSDLINIGRITKTYGDANGFKHRKELLVKWKQFFKV